MGGGPVDETDCSYTTLLTRLRAAGDPLSQEAAAYILALEKQLSANRVRTIRGETRKRLTEAKDQGLAIQARNRRLFMQEALTVLRGEAEKHSLPLEIYRAAKRGKFRHEGVYKCWQIASKFNITLSDLARFLRMDRSSVRHIAQKMGASRQISETPLGSGSGSVLSGSHHHGVSTSESDIHT